MGKVRKMERRVAAIQEEFRALAEQKKELEGTVTSAMEIVIALIRRHGSRAIISRSERLKMPQSGKFDLTSKEGRNGSIILELVEKDESS